MSLQTTEVFSATHARSRPNTPVHRHILAVKPRVLRNSGALMELRRQEPAPRRLEVLYKPGLHRPAVPCMPVGVPAQVPANQNRRPMRWPLKMPKGCAENESVRPNQRGVGEYTTVPGALGSSIGRAPCGLSKRQRNFANEPLVAPIKTHLTPELSSNYFFYDARAEPPVCGWRHGRAA
jgi:hypothetical protein